ncbi:MAG: MBL fold metallo-hydrolase [SAR202 cluster bacterium]|nr:MBL fold metallo-hydrolase [SAR202 cluster bacterium]
MSERRRSRGNPGQGEQMRRMLCLGFVTFAGVFATAASYEARQPRANLLVHEVADNLYMLANDPAEQGMRSGGNTAIFVMSSGVTLVDTKIFGYGQDILAKVRDITDKPVTRIINTHTHYDHSGGNVEFPDTVDVVVHENTLAQMSRASCESVTNCDAFKGENAKYLPKTTFSDRTTIGSGADQIDLYYFGRGHTDGDTFVVFRNARTLHTGDMFARKGLPFLDVPNGNGSALEFGETLRKAVAGIQGVDTVIPGHNDEPLVWNDLANYSGFYNDVVAKAKAGQSAGRSVDQVVDSYSVPSQYSDFVAEPDRLQATVQYVFDGR